MRSRRRRRGQALLAIMDRGTLVAPGERDRFRCENINFACEVEHLRAWQTSIDHQHKSSIEEVFYKKDHRCQSCR